MLIIWLGKCIDDSNDGFKCICYTGWTFNNYGSCLIKQECPADCGINGYCSYG